MGRNSKVFNAGSARCILSWVVALGTLGGFVSDACADIPPPPKPKSATAPVKIVRSQEAGSRLLIPKKLLEQLAADAKGEQASVPARTVIAGIVMALAAASSLFLLCRGRPKSVAAAVLTLGCVFAATAYADLIPPSKERPKQQIKVYATDGDTVVIELGREFH